MSVERHYEALLADVYSWMHGGADARVADQRAFFERHDIGPHASGRAVDVGAGSGFQTIALLERGFAVTAVDLSQKLLAELRVTAAGLGAHTTLETLRRDALPFDYVRAPVDVVVCMGDTLPHFESKERVRALLDEAHRHLVAGGRLVLTLRDLTRLPEGDARFLPIRSDGERIFTCFLEALDDERVRVHDLLHVRDGDGFRQHVSSYVKLRLSADWLDRALADAGFDVVFAASERGLLTRIARRA